MSCLLPLKICIPPLLDVVGDLYSTYMLNMDTDVEVGSGVQLLSFFYYYLLCVFGVLIGLTLSFLDLVITTAKYSLWPILHKILIS